MDTKIINLEWFQLSFAYIFIILLYIIVKIRKLSYEKEIILSSIRMTIQLILVGYILVYLFDNPSPIITILIIMLMELFSIYTIIKQVKIKFSSSLAKVILFSIFVGTSFCLLYFYLL